MRRWLQLFLLLQAVSALGYAPTPKVVLTAHEVGVVRPVVSDARGNVHGIFDTVELEVNWNGSRHTGYGAVPEYRPLSLSDNGDLGSASAWRGRWPDRSGLYWLGARYYDPVAGRFISCDPYGHDADPSLYAFADGDPINRFDPDGRLGKGWMEGWQVNSSSPADSSLAYDIGMTLGGIQGEYFRGLGGGGSITANTLTFGGSDYIGLTDSWQYQGGAYTGSRILATIGRESAIAAATLGTAQLARGGSQGALYTYQGLQTFNAGRSGYNIGEGGMRIAEGDAWGWVQVGAGGLGLAGSVTYAASNPGLNALGGVGPSSGGFAQGFVNWWNLGSSKDAAYLASNQKLLSEIGQNAVSGTSTSGRYAQIGGDAASATARGASILQGGNPIEMFGLNWSKIGQLLYTGPTSGARLNGPPALLITSGGLHVENATINTMGGSR